MNPDLLLPLAGMAGWILASLAIGLWFGERGRRIDLQRMMRRDRGSMKPEVVRTSDWEPASKLQDQEDRELFEKLVEDAMKEGHSKEEAEKDATRMMEQMRRLGAEDPY